MHGVECSLTPRPGAVNTRCVTVASATRVVGDRRAAETASGRRVSRNIARAGLAVVTFVWIRMTQDALRLRSIVTNYESVHDGDVRLGVGPWPDHVRQLHDELSAVGADYFYPFAWGMIIAVGLVWIGTATMATVAASWWRRGLIATGAGVVLSQLVLLGPALATYVNVTD